MRFISALRYDIKLQFRHGFYSVYLVISAVYIVLLYLLPPDYRETTDIMLTFVDPSMLGFFFIGGLVLLEKGQHIHDSLFVTPYKVAEYIWSKTLSLTLLSVGSSYMVHLSVFGLGRNPLSFLAGIALTSFFFTLIGLGVAVRCKTLNGFFLLSTLSTVLFFLPLAESIGAWNTPLFYLLPTKASLTLIGSIFHPLRGSELVYLHGMLIVWCGLAYVWTRRSFQQFIVLKIGGEG